MLTWLRTLQVFIKGLTALEVDARCGLLGFLFTLLSHFGGLVNVKLSRFVALPEVSSLVAVTLLKA